MIRVVTVGGEFGSGRAEIARIVSERLRWRLVDSALIEEIAREAQVDPELARRYDERVDPLLHRMQKALWHGGYEGVVTRTESSMFDADATAELSRQVIEQVAVRGDAVIVGRGSACILQQRKDVFHVFIYGPLEDRVARVRLRSPATADPERLIDDWDKIRQQYIRRYFGQDWTNRHLYDIMICSSMGEEAAAAAILAAVERHRS